MMNYHKLSGSQRRALRDVLLGGLDLSRAEVKMLLDDADLPSLDMLSSEDNLELQLNQAIRKLQKKENLPKLIETLKHSDDYANLTPVRTLDHVLSLAEPVVPAAAPPADFNLEKVVLDGGFHDAYLWAKTLMDLAGSICRISYPKGVKRVNGTGVALGSNQVLTNYHVVKPLIEGQANPEDVTLSFAYTETEDGLEVGQQLKLREDWLADYAPYSEADKKGATGTPGADELDFAVICTDAMDIPAGVDLADLGTPVGQNDILLILQHPSGQPLKVSLGQCTDVSVANRIRYNADTKGGSSGALVLDAGLKPIGLHHASDPDFPELARYNQGIPLHLIAAKLARG